MASFSEREYGFATPEIVDDAPAWLRANLFSQVIGPLLSPPLVGLSTKLRQPLSAKVLVEKLAAWSQTSPQASYNFSNESISILERMLHAAIWHHFYDFIELMARQLKSQVSQLLADDMCWPNFRNDVNTLFEDSNVGWSLDQDGLLQRRFSRDVHDLESQVLTASYLTAAAQLHLAKARKMLGGRTADFENSAKESLSSLESLGRKTFPNSSTFGDVLKTLRSKSVCPKGIVSILDKVYEFCNSTAGIRHAQAGIASTTRNEAEYIYLMSLGTAKYLGEEGII